LLADLDRDRERGSITVTDDGPGLAAAGDAGLPPLHELITRVWTGPTVDGHRPHVHLGIGGMGLFVVNALSEWFELRSVRGGIVTTAVYSRGAVVEPATTAPTSEPSGT
jgi:DNA gyrase subunit B